MDHQQIWAIANCTSVDAYLTGPNLPDSGPIPSGVITHTGGSGGNYIEVPVCWNSGMFPNGCLQLVGAGGAWNVYIWADAEPLLWWSTVDSMSAGQVLQNSSQNQNWSLLVQLVNGSVAVNWNPF